jgi:uncharacterized protein YbbC (DUF1343 family)
MKLGIDVLLENKKLQSELKGRRIALLAHPASVTHQLEPTLDALMLIPHLKITSAFGPQHGIRGEKQDNMEESEDFIDPLYKIPVFSLYGKVRRPTPQMLDTFDILLVDIQDIGTRIYTFLTTLLYVMEAVDQTKKEIWVLDRPNPAGRPVEGSLLIKNQWESFVGAAEFPMRHGLTLGEAAQWFLKVKNLNVSLKVVPMESYDPQQKPGYGWPIEKLPWVNPSPNAASLNMTRCFPGTVLIEGTHLSEARGTTHPLEMVGAPDLDSLALLKLMEKLASDWMKGCKIRPCYFQPTFHKHVGKICSGFQIHTDHNSYQHEHFKPYRLISLWLKAIRTLYPDYLIWRDFPYEYENDRLAIDLINGGPFLRTWVDDPEASVADFEQIQNKDEIEWKESREEFMIY